MLLQVKWCPVLFRSEYMNGIVSVWICEYIYLFFLLEVCDWEEILVNLWLLPQKGKHPTGWIKFIFSYQKASYGMNKIYFFLSEVLACASEEADQWRRQTIY